jgi:purine-binding chemotaxis protein CheW
VSEASGEGLRRAFERIASQRGRGAEGPAEEAIQVLTVLLADEWYGFRLTDLAEIIGGVEPTPIPFTPPFIPGVMNHRGTIVPVVDLHHVFGLPSGERQATARIALLKSGDAVVGFRVDAISDLVNVTRSALEPPLTTMERAKAAYIEGCVRLERGLLVVLSAEALIHGLEVRPET